ncbi:ankyrin-1-like [Mercenaria mercenaria]|uniref:ankyrin-1-like n=1 Tax=Mercenaria mercenaria TaxID=6596 RepID=UPI00234E586B|nr:ankyrin-1-like [Mercenaria mercenaria]
MNALEVSQEIQSLHAAVRSQNIGAVQNCIQSGVSVDSTDGAGVTPLLLAVLTHQPECVKLLLAAGSDVNYTTREHGTGLHIACNHGYLQIINSLLLAGTDCSLLGPDCQTCLHLAAKGGHLDVVKTLLYYKVPINVSDRQGLTPLHLSVMKDHEEVAIYLIENGALVNKQDLKGNSPLHYAVKQTNIELIKAIIAQGCDKDLMNNSQESPMYIAVRMGHIQTLLLLVKLGCRTDIKQAEGNCTIHTLVAKYNSQYPTDFRIVLEMLLYGGCDINTRAYNTLETPLYRAISLAKSDCAEVLLAYGADPNISSPFDITALRLAYMKKLSQAFVLMLHCGISWRRENWVKNLPLVHSSGPNSVLEKCTKWRKQPTSLLNICRIAFRKHCGKDLHRILVKRVDIPCALKNFVLLNDLKSQKYNSFLETFGGGSWVNSLLDEEIEYGPFKRRKNDIPDIC